MNLLNLKVKHKVFGNGVVTGISDNLLTIQFASKVSNFVYPDAFETFIVAEDTSVQSEILSEIENNKRAVRKQRLAEETAHKAEKELRVTERMVLLHEEFAITLRMALDRITTLDI